MRKFIKYKGNYIISDYGEIWKITKKGLVKRKFQINKGYYVTSINGKVTKVHRAVLEAFKGESSLVVDHLNGVKTDNRIYNLEYVTQEVNIKRACNKQVLWNGHIYDSARELSLELGLHKTAVTSCIWKGAKVKGYYAKYI